MCTEAFDQARIVEGFTESGEAADQPQWPKRLMPQDVQGAVAVWAVEQGEGDHADCGEAGADHQRIGQHHGQAFA
ncbi:hypothetical protein D3C84_697460 [compost metagenome]